MKNDKHLFFVFHLVGELVGFTEATSRTSAANQVKIGNVTPLNPVLINGPNRPLISWAFTYEDMEEFLRFHSSDRATRLLDAYVLSTKNIVTSKDATPEIMDKWQKNLRELRMLIDKKEDEEEA